jgi:DNA (cytosine-5)-methyltransferase 1
VVEHSQNNLEKENKPKYLFLENVDRLLISPSGQRGRDFAIILQSLNELGYAVEWRVINAADFGMPQRRRRVFILAYLQGTNIYDRIQEITPKEWILEEGTLASIPITSENILFQQNLYSKEILFQFLKTSTKRNNRAF